MRHVPFHGMAIIQTIGTRTPCKGGYYEQRDEELIHDGVLFNYHTIVALTLGANAIMCTMDSLTTLMGLTIEIDCDDASWRMSDGGMA